jgi:hypothetical protein
VLVKQMSYPSCGQSRQQINASFFPWVTLAPNH